MSLPGYNSHGSTLNGPAQSYPPTYQPSTYYGAPPTPPQGYPSKPQPSSAPSVQYYYQNNHIPAQTHPVITSAPPLQQYPSGPLPTGPPACPEYSQQSAYNTPESYYSNQSYVAAPPALQPIRQQYTNTPASAGAAGTYTPQAQSSLGGLLPVQTAAPLHQYSPVRRPPSESSSATLGHQQTAINGQPQGSPQSQQHPSTYGPYNGVDGSGHTPLSTGTPSASVGPSPGQHQAPQPQYAVYKGTSGPSGPAESSSSSEDDDLDDDEDEDEEAGAGM